MNLFSQKNTSTTNQIETWASPEQKEEFDKKWKEFQEKYEQKLKNILAENILKKISASFELNWDIEKTVDSLKNYWVSEELIDSIKKYLTEDVSIKKEDLDKITNQIDDFSNQKDLDLRLWDLIWKAVKKSEETWDDDLFDMVNDFRKIQQSWTMEEKSSSIAELESILKENNENTQNFQEKNENTDESWEIEVWEYKEDNRLDEYDMEAESNDYWAEKVVINENTDFSYVNWEFYPILKSLNSNWDIKNEDFDKINKDLASLNWQEKIDKFLSFIENISNSESKENILKKFKDQEIVNSENFDDTVFASDVVWKIDLDKSVWWLEEMLAENYIYLPNKESWEELNKENSLNSSLDLTLHSIIKNKTDDFKNNNYELISKVKSEENLNVKYQLLKKLYKNSLLEDAKYWWKKWEEELNHKKSSLKDRYTDLLEKIKEANKIADGQEKQAELKKLQSEQNKIIEESKEIEWFSKELSSIDKEVWTTKWAISSWKDDKLKESTEKTKE